MSRQERDFVERRFGDPAPGAEEPVVLTRQEILRAPMPGLAGSMLARGVIRGATLILNQVLLGVKGLHRIDPVHDPFLFVANHNHRLEAPMFPALLSLRRGGDMVHFLADWPLRILPPMAYCCRVAQVITVTRKDARPRWLNILRPLFHEPLTAYERALERLRSGRSVGLFPEGTMNRHPHLLLRGRSGAARLALESGVPVVPGGIRFPQHEGDGPLSDYTPMEIEIGEPFHPPHTPDPSEEQVEDFHRVIMQTIEGLSGKSWSPDAPIRRFRFDKT